IILIDHQPFSLDDAQRAGVDLQVSGHTHNGQFFPNNLITALLFEIDWGFLKKGNLNVVVSCGYSTWGPPIRNSSYSEIVKLNITFSK
ncbi:MAG: metallophosphoesterase, partial [bacterium]|nr:metallophosphoesterase [bacterium]